jgi:glycosyltransferase involved in cell wall biosynthesis
MKNKLISIVIPVYNSEETIVELTNAINDVFTKNNINDGSTDGSWLEIEKVKSQYTTRIKAINFTKNFGQHNALLCGFNFCSGDFVVTLDDDLQHPPSEILKLIETQQQTGCDVVYGIYKTKQHSFIRNFFSSIVRNTSDFKSQNKKGGSSFRILHIKLVEEVIKQHQNHFLFLDAIINWYTGNIEVVEVDHYSRKKGKSGYTFLKLFSIYLNVLYHYSTKPLKIIIYGGLFTSIVSFLLGLKFIYQKMIYDVPLGYTSLIVAIMFSTSLILFCLGIIGNYLYKLYQMQQNKPPYSIQKII